mgnify:CR=1 FL=1
MATLTIAIDLILTQERKLVLCVSICYIQFHTCIAKPRLCLGQCAMSTILNNQADGTQHNLSNGDNKVMTM